MNPFASMQKSSNGKIRTAGSVLTVVLVGVILLFAGITLFTGSVRVHVGEESVEIKSDLFTTSVIAYQDIQQVEMVENLDIGSRSFGVSSMKLKSGTFTNGLYGSYTLHSEVGAKKFAVLHTSGGIVVFAFQQEQKTADTAAEIQNHIK